MTFEIVGSALLLGICAFLLKGFGFKGAPVFAAVAAVLLVSEAGDEFGYIFGSVKKIAEERIARYTKDALTVLEEISIDDDAKEAFRSFADMLMSRTK